MPHISILSSSLRTGCKSQSVSQYFQNYLSNNNLATTEILDLKKASFPIFEYPIKKQKKTSEQVIGFANKVKSSDGIIIVTPEYNCGYPASLKNILDLLYYEWHGKPISVCTISAGTFGGTQALVSLQFTLWKIGKWTITNLFCVSNVSKTFDNLGNPLEKVVTDKLADTYIKELLECVKAIKQVAIE